MHSFTVVRHKTSLMQELLTRVSRGYEWHLSGEIDAKKVPALIEKFAQKYHIFADKNQRHYRKCKGRANAILFLYPQKYTTGFFWWLLATDGDGAVHEQEALKQVCQHPITWGSEYEIKHLSSPDKKTRWTWRMTKAQYHAWHERIRLSIRSRTTEAAIQAAIWVLFRAPGFRGIREQVKQLRYQIIKEWQRTRKDRDELPSLPDFIGYRRYKEDEKIPVSVLLKRIQQGRTPFPHKKTELDTMNGDI